VVAARAGGLAAVAALADCRAAGARSQPVVVNVGGDRHLFTLAALERVPKARLGRLALYDPIQSSYNRLFIYLLLCSR